MKYRLLLFSVFMVFLAVSPALAHPKKCSSDEIAKLARGGFTDAEIRGFCTLEKAAAPSKNNLREKYAKLEGKNWRTHFYLSSQRRKREEVFFVVSENTVQIKSSNPKVQYYDVKDLGDTLRFKRKQSPYKAIYVLTLETNQMTAQKLPVVQQYKAVKNYFWTAR